MNDTIHSYRGQYGYSKCKNKGIIIGKRKDKSNQDECEKGYRYKIDAQQYF